MGRHEKEKDPCIFELSLQNKESLLEGTLSTNSSKCLTVQEVCSRARAVSGRERCDVVEMLPQFHFQFIDASHELLLTQNSNINPINHGIGGTSAPFLLFRKSLSPIAGIYFLFAVFLV